MKAVDHLTRHSHQGIGGRDATILATADTLGLRRIMTHDKVFQRIDWLKVIDPVPDHLD